MPSHYSWSAAPRKLKDWKVRGRSQKLRAKGKKLRAKNAAGEEGPAASWLKAVLQTAIASSAVRFLIISVVPSSVIRFFFLSSLNKRVTVSRDEPILWAISS